MIGNLEHLSLRMFSYYFTTVLCYDTPHHFCRFTYTDIGAEGRNSDGGVYGSCGLNRKLETNSLSLPPDRTPEGGSQALPYVMLADEAFPLRSHMMKPYNRRQLDHDKRVRAHIPSYQGCAYWCSICELR